MNNEIFTRTHRGIKETLIVMEEEGSRLSDLVPKLCCVASDSQIYWVRYRSGFTDTMLSSSVLTMMMRTGSRTEAMTEALLDSILSLMSTEGGLPTREETRSPSTLPVVLSSDWGDDWSGADWRSVSVLSSLGDWDFYDTRWLLHKWESGLGMFDDDVLYLSIPVYPSDLYNQRVRPDLVLREIERYKKAYGEESLEKNFFALYLLSRDDLGKKVLGFFYECEETHPDPPRVFDMLYDMYRGLSPGDEYYRPYLFEKNYSVLELHKRLVFKPYMFVNQYLSYHGMYVSKDFFQLHRSEILQGLRRNLKELGMNTLPSLPTQRFEEFADHEFTRLYSLFDHEVHWVGKWHLEKYLQDSLLWKTVLGAWDTTPRRNIYLWESSSFQYKEHQLRIGYEFKLLFDTKTTATMNKQQKTNLQLVFFKKK